MLDFLFRFSLSRFLKLKKNYFCYTHKYKSARFPFAKEVRKKSGNLNTQTRDGRYFQLPENYSLEELIIVRNGNGFSD